MKHLCFLLTAVFALAVLAFAEGCSPQERAGVSPLPQNRPAQWEYNPLAR